MCWVKLVCMTPEQSRVMQHSGARLHVYCLVHLCLDWQGDPLEDWGWRRAIPHAGQDGTHLWWYPSVVTPCNATCVTTYGLEHMHPYPTGYMWSRIFLAVFFFLLLGFSWVKREAEGTFSLTVTWDLSFSSTAAHAPLTCPLCSSSGFGR